MTLGLFGIQCTCMHDLAVVFIFTMFHVLYSRVCVGRGIVTISKMLYIYYHQGSIVLTVCADYFYFHRTSSSLIFPTSSILMLLCGFSRPVEIMYQIEGCNIICCLLLKISTLVITYIAYE